MGNRASFQFKEELTFPCTCQKHDLHLLLSEVKWLPESYAD